MSFVPQPCPSPDHLDCDTDSITVCQGTTPWVVQGVDAIVRDLSCDLDSVTVCQLDTFDVAITGIVDVNIVGDDYVLETPTVTSVAGSAVAVNLLASNTLARQRIIHNDSTAILFIKFGAGASTTDFSVRLSSQAMFVFPTPMYVGLVTGIWQAATGFARITEVQV